MKRKVIYLIFLGSFVLGCTPSFSKSARKNSGESLQNTENISIEKTYKSVSMEQGLLLMEKDDNYILLDVRRKEEYEAGHIPGAVLLTAETFTESDAEKIIQDKIKNVYVYCRSGRRSKIASQKLSEAGYTNVIEIGGIIDYSGKIEK